MSENGVKTMKDFAAEWDIHPHTVGDIVDIHNLPTERMTHGRAKGLAPKTQKDILRILGIKASRRTVSV